PRPATGLSTKTPCRVRSPELELDPDPEKQPASMASASPVSGHCHPRRARGTSVIILIVCNYLLLFLYVADPPKAPMRDTSQDRPVMHHNRRMMLTDKRKSP